MTGRNPYTSDQVQNAFLGTLSYLDQRDARKKADADRDTEREYQHSRDTISDTRYETKDARDAALATEQLAGLKSNRDTAEQNRKKTDLEIAAMPTGDEARAERKRKADNDAATLRLREEEIKNTRANRALAWTKDKREADKNDREQAAQSLASASMMIQTARDTGVPVDPKVWDTFSNAADKLGTPIEQLRSPEWQKNFDYTANQIDAIQRGEAKPSNQLFQSAAQLGAARFARNVGTKYDEDVMRGGQKIPAGSEIVANEPFMFQAYDRKAGKFIPAEEYTADDDNEGLVAMAKTTVKMPNGKTVTFVAPVTEGRGTSDDHHPEIYSFKQFQDFSMGQAGLAKVMADPYVQKEYGAYQTAKAAAAKEAATVKYQDVKEPVMGADGKPQVENGKVVTTTRTIKTDSLGREVKAAPAEGATATNPKTGERLVYKGGKWVSAGG